MDNLTYYEIFLGGKSIRILSNLREVYQFIKQVHLQCLVYPQQPLARMKGLKQDNGFIASYVLFEVDKKLYIRSIKVVKSCLIPHGISDTDAIFASIQRTLHLSPQSNFLL